MAVVTGTFEEEVAADNPYRWFRFQESSGNNRHGSLIGSPSRVSGPVDWAISLSGSSQAVNGNITALGANIAAATFEVTIATADTRQQSGVTLY